MICQCTPTIFYVPHKKHCRTDRTLPIDLHCFIVVQRTSCALQQGLWESWPRKRGKAKSNVAKRVPGLMEKAASSDWVAPALVLHNVQ